MNALILAVLICICVALYAIWSTQTEILKVLRQINLKVLNVGMFLKPELEPDVESAAADDGKPN